MSDREKIARISSFRNRYWLAVGMNTGAHEAVRHLLECNKDATTADVPVVEVPRTVFDTMALLAIIGMEVVEDD